MRFDDKITVFAIAVMAGCVATAAHEAAGHGAACALLGGSITRLTSVYFQCSIGSPWIAAGGPLGNLFAFTVAWLGLAFAPAGMVRLRLLLLLLSTFSIFCFAGYLIYSALLNDGDIYFVARDLLGRPGLALRAAQIALGAACYWAGIRIMATYAVRIFGDPGRARDLLRWSWISASLSACLAALAYAPGRLGAIGQAALEIGAASLPMLGRPGAQPEVNRQSSTGIERSSGWIGAAVAIFVLFVATLGRGLP